MNCAIHTDVENTAFCIRCGKPLCDECIRRIDSSIYCENCLAEISSNVPSGNPGHSSATSAERPALRNVQQAGGTSPEAGFLLGLIPGVGAIYNAEYFKAALHLLIFSTLVTLVDMSDGHGDALLAFFAFGFYVYMPFEAYYTAKKRKLAREGINLITPFDQLKDQMGQVGDMELWGGIILVLAGSLFLLDNFNVISLREVGRFWPAILILVGILFIRRFLKGTRA